MKNWQHVANCLPGRAANQCNSRWRLESRAETIHSGKWSDLEERRLILAVLAYGEKNLSRQTLTPQLEDTSADVVSGSSNSRPKKRQGLDERIWMKISQHVPGRYFLIPLVFADVS